MSGSINIGIPDITVVIRENTDANKVLLDTPNISVTVQKGPDYNVNIQPSSLVVQRTGSLPLIAVSAYSSAFAQTASFALNAGEGTGFPFSGSAVITGSLRVLNAANIGGITGSLQGTASVASGIDIIFAGNYRTGSEPPVIITPSGTFSYVTYAETAAYFASDAVIESASYAGFAQTASYFSGELVVSSASYATTALFVLQNQFTGSFTGSFYGTLSGSVEIPEDGLLILKPRNIPAEVIVGAVFLSTSGELYLGT